MNLPVALTAASHPPPKPCPKCGRKVGQRLIAVRPRHFDCLCGHQWAEEKR